MLCWVAAMRCATRIERCKPGRQAGRQAGRHPVSLAGPFLCCLPACLPPPAPCLTSPPLPCAAPCCTGALLCSALQSATTGVITRWQTAPMP